MAKNSTQEGKGLRKPLVAESLGVGIVNPPATVEEYISGVILKELWAVELARQSSSPSAARFDPDVSKRLVARVSRRLSNDIMDAVRGWIPVAEELQATSLLPDLHEFPPYAADEDGVTLGQRRLLLEALTIVFDTFNPDTGANHGQDSEPMLPPASVACISVQLAGMLEHLSLTNSHRGQALLQQGDLDLDSWQNVCANAGETPHAGTKAELVNELQECRCRIFDLEKEFLTQSKASAAAANREKRETEKAIQRFLTVNQALEEKLKVRTHSLYESDHRNQDLERRVAHEEALLQEKNKKILRQQQDLERLARKQDDLLLRERKYGERILELRLEEFKSTHRDKQRKTRLVNMIEGKMVSEGEDDLLDSVGEYNEGDMESLAKRTLLQVTSQFDDFIEEREAKIIHVAKECEAQMALEQTQTLQVLEKDTHLPHKVRLSIRQTLNKGKPGTDVSVQTEASGGALASSQKRGSVLAEPTRRNSISIRDITPLVTGRRASAFEGLDDPDMALKDRIALKEVQLHELRLRHRAEQEEQRLRGEKADDEEDEGESPLSSEPGDEPGSGQVTLDPSLRRPSQQVNALPHVEVSPPSIPQAPASSPARRSTLPSPFRAMTPSTQASSRAESRSSFGSPLDRKQKLRNPGTWEKKTTRRSVLTFERTV